MPRLAPLALTLFALLAHVPAAVTHAASEDLDRQRDQLLQIETLFIELDALASTCLASFNLNLGEAAALLCDEFIRAVDGEPVATLLALCAELESQGTGQTAPSGPASPTAEALSALTARTAQQLTSLTSRYCARDGLAQHTEFVVPAFDTLRRGSALNQTLDQPLETRLRELEYRLIESGERDRLRQALRESQLQRQQATERQMQQLENELIRQQRLPNP
jgi:hypothetical protein